jgi:hypothetical protein
MAYVDVMLNNRAGVTESVRGVVRTTVQFYSNGKGISAGQRGFFEDVLLYFFF